jgi:hypothetical protein
MFFSYIKKLVSVKKNAGQITLMAGKLSVAAGETAL